MIPPLGEWIDARAFSLPISAFRDYLLTHGWTLQSSSRSGFVCAGPLLDDGTPIIMVMPASTKAYDFPLRVDDFFRRLSILEERHPMEILQEMLRQAEAGSNERNGANGAHRAKRPTRIRKTQLKK
jgi:hypothetical protein